MGHTVDGIGGASFSWWDFLCWVRHVPVGTNLHRLTRGDHYPLEWQILGGILEALRTANWQRGRAGARPKPIRWPWLKNDDVTSFGRAAPIEDVRAALLARTGRTPRG